MAKVRKDIEGLRAIAVSSILLFHFGYAGLGGGFVGVDIFFAISGFLIGRSVIGQAGDGRLSLLDFWARRIRRLYPALVAMLLATAAASWWLLFPIDLAAFGKSMVATAGYGSNILFRREAGYFDPDAIVKPLLHTWSLAVEEQFYIAFPLLVLLLTKAGASRRMTVATIAALAAASLVAAQLVLATAPAATFYLFPLRAWELLAGVLVGAVGWGWLASRAPLREAMAAAGLLLIVGTILRYGPATPFPGLAAVPPVLGTALVIAAGGGGGTAIGRALAWPPLGLIGLVSYSLYLWHWPLVVLLTYYHGGGPLPQGWRLGGIAATALLAAASWRFVEEPLRWRRGPLWRLFAATAAVTLLLSAIGLTFYRSGGLPGRYRSTNAVLATASSDFMQQRGTCVDESNTAIPGLAFCRIGDPARAPDFLVWADSHGRAFRDGIDLAATEHRRAGLLVWAGGCPPVFGIRKVESANTPAEDTRCYAQTEALGRYLKTDRRLRDVLLIGRWAYYTEGGGTGGDAHNRIRLVSPTDPAEAASLETAMRATAATLIDQGRHLFVLEQVTEIPRFSALSLAQRVLGRLQALPTVLADIGTVDRAAVERRQARAERMLDGLARQGATVIRSRAAFCDAARCTAWHVGQPLLFDNNHVTVRASLALRRLFDPVFARSGPGGGHRPPPAHP